MRTLRGSFGAIINRRHQPVVGGREDSVAVAARRQRRGVLCGAARRNHSASNNKEDCARAEDACNKQGHREDASRDRRRRQKEAPVEEGQPDCGQRGGAVVQ